MYYVSTRNKEDRRTAAEAIAQGLAVDGGLRWNNMDPVVECNPDVVILSSAIFKEPDGIAAGVQKCRKALDDAAAKYGL